MIGFGESSSFKRAYKRLIMGNPDLESAFRERLILFVNNPFEPSLNTHKLSGRMKGQSAFSLTFKLRVVFTFTRSDFAMLEDIGTHDQVY
jgi:mRNA-degrading endonuclease YafQ of YafQ-DinJ toxin-antitoxin module